MNSTSAFVVGSCEKCHGTGVCRDTKHFFYGVCLVAFGVLCFFNFPPTPWLIATISDFTLSIGLATWIGKAAVWVLTGVPPLFGLAFIYLWIARETCPACHGRRQDTRMGAPKTS